MQAYRTILTHFSQRYPHMPEGLDSLALPLRDRPAIAFDGMLVPFNLLPALPLLAPAVAQVLLKEEEATAPAHGDAKPLLPPNLVAA